MLRDEEVITLADEATDAFHALPDAAKSMEMWKLYIARAVEQAAYERAAAHVRTLKRDWWRLRAAPEIVVEECAVAIEKLMTQEQPK